MDDFVNAIAYEVKLEIASRYFGFRSRVEAEIGQYQERLHLADRDYLDAIRLDLQRMRFLLHQEKAWKDFLFLIQLPEDSPILHRQPSPNVSQLFSGLKGVGFSRWRRYRDLALKVYRSLENSITAYRETCLDLGDERAELCARIDQFHRNNDLSGILSFLKTFDSSENERLKFLHSLSTPHPGENIDQDLRIPHPRPVADLLPDLPALPPLRKIEHHMTALLKTSFYFHSSLQF